MTKGRNRSKEHKNNRNNWATPIEVVDEIQDFLGIVGLPLMTLDVAASQANAKCPLFYTAKENALLLPWSDGKGGFYWGNPPFDQAEAFMQKAHEELLQGRQGILLLPNNAETIPFRRWITDLNRPRLMWPKRISFLDEETGLPANGNTTGSWIVAFFREKSIKKLKATGNRLAGQPFIVNL